MRLELRFITKIMPPTAENVIVEHEEKVEQKIFTDFEGYALPSLSEGPISMLEGFLGYSTCLGTMSQTSSV